jgi:hypothetical protein
VSAGEEDEVLPQGGDPAAGVHEDGDALLLGERHERRDRGVRQHEVV